MKDYQLTKYTLDDFCHELVTELAETPALIVTTKSASIGKWGMTRLWYKWMSITGEWMAGRGCTMPLYIDATGKPHGSRAYNAADAHEQFVGLWLGHDDKGNRLSWSTNGRDGMRAASKGERFGALRSHEEFAAERGLILFKPRGSEYQKLLDEENGR